MTLPKALSPLPWTYRTDDDGWRDWIEDAVGNVVVENIGVIDGPFIVERANAALSQPEAQAVPEGWKLVPIEPTQEMIRHGSREVSLLTHEGAMCCYRAMLSASGEPT